METLEITGGNRLCGQARIKGAKNAILPLLAASAMTEDVTVIRDCPNISDVEVMLKILKTLGVTAQRSGDTIFTEGLPTVSEVPEELSGQMRSSVFLLGALLSRTGYAKLSMPGGCAIGARPLDIHINCLKNLGVRCKEGERNLEFSSEGLHGGRAVLSYPSVGATENLIMTAALASGETLLENCAKEPEIVDLSRFLNACGAKISGYGTNIVHIEGVQSLHGTEYTPMPDRIVAGTLLLAAATAGGNLLLDNVVPEHLAALLVNLPKTACSYRVGCDSIEMRCDGRGSCPLCLETAPYPGFPTDLQAQFAALASVSTGTCRLKETVFESRFAHARELAKLGADVSIDGSTVEIRGSRLHGARVTACDLRGGAGLVIAALAAEGRTLVDGVEHIDRGYEKLENLLGGLGANIARKAEI